jgi:hypothetical protein
VADKKWLSPFHVRSIECTIIRIEKSSSVETARQKPPDSKPAHPRSRWRLAVAYFAASLFAILVDQRFFGDLMRSGWPYNFVVFFPSGFISMAAAYYLVRFFERSKSQ